MAHGFGIIGCGMIANFHAKAIGDIEDAHVVACFDMFPASADKLAESQGCKVYRALEDMLADPHFNARGLFETVEIDGEPLKIPAILPRLSRTPGATRWPGGDLGSGNSEILGELLGIDEDQLQVLKDEGVII